MLRPVCVIILALSAAACGGSDDANSRAPASKILARSTTDDMLALENIQSQAPLAEPAAATPGKKSGQDTKAGDDAAPVDEIAPAPLIESPPPTDTIGAAISGRSAPDNR